jgi:hypothetical protein
MPINCICPKCRKPLTIDDKYAGQPMKCPMCTAMFQSPSLAAVTAEQANPFSSPPGAGYSGPAPPWASAPPKDPSAPAWPTLVNPAVSTAAGEFGSVSPGAPKLLAPGWHTVLRGMGLLPAATLVLFITIVLGRLTILVAPAEPEVLKIVLLIAVPIAILSSMAIMVGTGLCCLVPADTKLRGLALAATAAMFLCLLSLLLAIFLHLAQSGATFAVEYPRVAPLVRFMMWTAFIAGLLLMVGTGVLFLLFLRGIARNFDNKRLAKHLLWYLAFYVLSPAFGLIVLSLFKGTDLILGMVGMSDAETRGAVYVVYSIVVFILIAVVLTGFLLVLRDTRTTIERAIVASKV